MKIVLLQAHGNFKPGREWNCPVASLARKLIEEGKALAIEACDLHLNPPESESPAEQAGDANIPPESETPAEQAGDANIPPADATAPTANTPAPRKPRGKRPAAGAGRVRTRNAARPDQGAVDAGAGEDASADRP